MTAREKTPKETKRFFKIEQLVEIKNNRVYFLKKSIGIKRVCFPEFSNLLITLIRMIVFANDNLYYTLVGYNHNI